jgi:hypothetical protein
MTPEQRKQAEEILRENLSDTLWTFINTYPVAYKADIMLKDWIIEAMEALASLRVAEEKRMPTEEEKKAELKSYLNKLITPFDDFVKFRIETAFEYGWDACYSRLTGDDK